MALEIRLPHVIGCFLFKTPDVSRCLAGFLGDEGVAMEDVVHTPAVSNYSLFLFSLFHLDLSL